MANKKELFPPDDPIVQGAFHIYNLLASIKSYHGNEKRRTAKRPPHLCWPKKEIERAYQIYKDAERMGWLEDGVASKLREKFILEVHLSPNASVFVLQTNRKNLALDFLICVLVDYAKRKTNKPSYRKVAAILDQHGIEGYVYYQIKRRYDRASRKDIHKLLTHVGLIDADGSHAEEHISRILNILAPK